MSFKPHLFLKELFLFGSTLILSIVSAYYYSTTPSSVLTVPVSLSLSSVVFFLVFFVAISVMLIKFRRFNRFFFRFFLILVVFSGAESVSNVFIGFPWNIVLALALTTTFYLVRNVFVHDLAMIVALAGISGTLGLSISPETGVILLIALSIYDILAVYWTKHMVYMAKGMIESGAIFGFIIPFDIKDIFSKNDEAHAKIGEKFMILGSGDIALPAIFAASIAVGSLHQSIIVGLFSVLGLFLTHLIFINQRISRPMAALPPIATMTVIGYLVSQFW